ncbi:MAG: OsmC family protein [Bacteriovoracaceae bacterium]|nr:OsmC family protein [Bacteriovoracaceae bacterium]
MISYPLSFSGNATSLEGIKTSWSCSASEHQINCAVPKEFDGSGDGLSPEDIYLLALQNCLIGTFKVYAHYSKLNFSKIEVKSELIVDLDENKKPCMKKIFFHIDILEASDSKKAQIILKKALDNGFILQSVKTEIIPVITIS